MENEKAEIVKEAGKIGLGYSGTTCFKSGQASDHYDSDNVIQEKSSWERTEWLGSKNGIQIFFCVHQ